MGFEWNHISNGSSFKWRQRYMGLCRLARIEQFLDWLWVSHIRLKSVISWKNGQSFEFFPSCGSHFLDCSNFNKPFYWPRTMSGKKRKREGEIKQETNTNRCYIVLCNRQFFSKFVSLFHVIFEHEFYEQWILYGKINKIKNEHSRSL